jgi:hypothetical protein
MKKPDTLYITLKDLKNKAKNDKWAKRLADYNNYVKEYIKHYKKSLTGNSISLAKYPYMKIKSELLADRLNKARNKSDLDEKQIKKFSKITMKIVNSACE